MAKLSDKDKKKIMVDSANGMSERQIAAKYHVSNATIHRVLAGNPETKQIVAQKKEQNTLEMLEFMDAQRGRAQELLTAIVDAMNDPEKLAKANVRDLATAFGIIADKFIQASPKANDGLLQKAADILGNINGVIK